MPAQFRYSVFTKPWKMPVPKLGAHVRALGFDGVEFPVRPEYPVEPGNVTKGLPEAAKQLAEFDLGIFSVAGPMDEPTIAACGEAGVPILRVMATIGPDESYTEAETRTLREFDAAVPLLEKHGVVLGVQNHCNRFVNASVGVRRLVENYDPKLVAVVWDPSHSAIAGETADISLDILGPRVCMVNLKNAIYQRTNGPEAENVQWTTYWTSGPQGLADWPKVADELKKRDWSGVVCLCAEYADHDAVNRLTAEDFAWAKSLLA